MSPINLYTSHSILNDPFYCIFELISLTLMYSDPKIDGDMAGRRFHNLQILRLTEIWLVVDFVISSPHHPRPDPFGTTWFVSKTIRGNEILFYVLSLVACKSRAVSRWRVSHDSHTVTLTHHVWSNRGNGKKYLFIAFSNRSHWELQESQRIVQKFQIFTEIINILNFTRALLVECRWPLPKLSSGAEANSGVFYYY
jgi:hypothetical protein